MEIKVEGVSWERKGCSSMDEEEGEGVAGTAGVPVDGASWGDMTNL